jgi:cold shock protein
MDSTNNQGLVKWFNNNKGWGFIAPEAGGEDIFVHYSEIHGDGFKTLKEGEKVNFELTQGEKGLYAKAVTRA